RYDGPGGTLQSREETFAGGVRVRGELRGGRWVAGTVRVTLQDGSEVFYERVGDGWRLYAANQQTQEGWVEEQWGANGAYSKNVWTKRQHDKEGSKDHKSSIWIEGGRLTVTLYNVEGYTYWWGGAKYTAKNGATARWVCSVDANGKPNYDDLLEYRVTSHGGDYANHWKKLTEEDKRWPWQPPIITLSSPQEVERYWGNGWKEWVYG